MAAVAQLQTTFLLEGKSCKVTLEKKGLTWCFDDRPQDLHFIQSSELICCWLCTKGSFQCISNGVVSSSQNTDCRPRNTPKPEITIDDSDIRLSSHLSVSNLEVASSADTLSTSCSFEPVNLSDTNSDITKNIRNSNISSSEINLEKSCTTNKSNNSLERLSICKPNPSDNHCIHENINCKNPFAGLSIEFCDKKKPLSLSCCIGEKDSSREVVTWYPKVIVFRHFTRSIVLKWMEEIRNMICAQPDRPRKLCVMVNPCSGRGNASTIYKRRVAPLLNRAGIQTTVHETGYSGHGKIIARRAVEADGVDGVVVVGGDGIIMEAANGMIADDTQSSDGEEFKLKCRHIPRLAPIAGGSTNAYVTSIHGTSCPVHATLHIIMGSRMKADVAAVYDAGQFQTYVVSGVHFGILGRIQEQSSRMKRYGPLKDMISSCTQFGLNRPMTCTIEASTQKASGRSVCKANCAVCQNDTIPTKPNSNWCQTDLEIATVLCCLNTLECKFSKYGMSPYAHLGDGKADLVILPKCSNISLWKHLYTYTVKDTMTDDPSVIAIKGTEFRFNGFRTAMPFNCDGELLFFSDVTVRVLRQRLPLFSRGKEYF